MNGDHLSSVMWRVEGHGFDPKPYGHKTFTVQVLDLYSKIVQTETFIYLRCIHCNKYQNFNKFQPADSEL
jgi:hypothetical protein